ncbi:MAG TPA: HesA/MoeB/ThiF family protein [Kiritimatiellia bacterium]|nr:HesA/MoeB/ThiF family protein [Kiritimatiellia bacterium]HOM59245.1 HesA/MoeB/ThiF family protein [Kiritimatiellia bacterium]HOR98527.1 HesA/MoeB/ThiF family protein [Kiritimatiellia bacterium]HPC49253.1 HesA/MoeB/ThiF family protein [Kiritimatiellia bacterium]HPK37777.1 HesA/MoeB/ThiF family protein [Kiritimatiellia bacterium]
MRYRKQILAPCFGEATQHCLAKATVAIVGCGGLGTWQAELLARMGIGRLRLADDDRVTLENLHRQILFTEQDAVAGLLKVRAAAARLRQINTHVVIEPYEMRITRDTLDAFAAEADLVLDATDHAPTRFLINDFCLAHAIPWIYTGVAGEEGLILPVLPSGGPCLRCLYPDPPEPDETANCRTDGILPMTVAMAVSLQIAQAVRVLNGNAEPGTLIRFNVWSAVARRVRLERLPTCPGCGLRLRNGTNET